VIRIQVIITKELSKDLTGALKIVRIFYFFSGVESTSNALAIPFG
jgi:hypothetical protein